MAIKRAVPLLAACVLALAACGSGSKSTAEPVLTIAPTTSTTTAVDYSVPKTIDAAYLNKVMKAINHVRGDIRRDTVKTHVLSDADKQMLADIYADKALEGNLQIWSDGVKSVDPRLKPVPGDEVEQVQNILVAHDDCVVFTALDDGSAMYNAASKPTGPWVLSLWTFDGAHRDNPTPWKVELDVLQGDPGSDYRC